MKKELFSSIGKILQSLDKRQKSQLYFLIVLILISVMLEAFGIGLVIPIVSLILDPKSILQNEFIAGIFNDTKGSINAALNLAKYLGFSKTILVGCDYLMDPALQLHFYSNCDPFIDGTTHQEYISDAIKSAESLDVTLLVPDGYTSSAFNYITYKKLFGHTEKLKMNYEIISKKNLKIIRFLSKKKQIFL